MTTPRGQGDDIHHPNDIHPPGKREPQPIPETDRPAQEIPGDDGLPSEPAKPK